MKKFQSMAQKFLISKLQTHSLIAFFIVFLTFGVFIVTKATRAGSESGLITPKATQDALTGQWTAEFNPATPGKMRVTLQRRSKEHGIRTETIMPTSRELQGLTPEEIASAKTIVNFRIAREAGTFELEGYFSEGKGAGFWTLTPSRSFISAMRSRGYNNLTENDLFSAAVGNVSVKQIEDLKSLGYDRLSFEQLFLAGAFKVNPEFIGAWRSAGFTNLSFEELVQLGMFKVTPEFLNEIKAEGFSGLSLSTAVNLKIHKIDRDFIRRVKAGGFPNVTLGELINLRIHNKVK